MSIHDSVWQDHNFQTQNDSQSLRPYSSTAEAIAVRLADVERRLDLTQQQLSQILATASNRRVFITVTICHLIPVIAISLFAMRLPESLVNGWLYGSLITSAVWFGASQRPTLALWIRLCLSCVAILLTIFLALALMLEEVLPDVWMVVLIEYPLMMATSVLVFRICRIGLIAPDLSVRRPKGLTIVSCLSVTAVYAATIAYFHQQELGNEITDYDLHWVFVTGYLIISVALVSTALAAFGRLESRYLGGIACATLYAVFFVASAAIPFLLKYYQLADYSWIPLSDYGWQTDYVECFSTGDYSRLWSIALFTSFSVLLPLATFCSLRWQGYVLR